MEKECPLDKVSASNNTFKDLCCNTGFSNSRPYIKIPSLPVEIVEKILSYVKDAKTLVQAGRVCTTWKAIQLRLNSNKLLWKTICQNEVKHEDILEIKQQLFPASRAKTIWNDPYINWYSMCKLNYMWKLVGKYDCEVRHIYERQHRNHLITCVKLTGSCIVTGHNDGAIHIWSQDGVFLDQLAQHLLPVTDLELISFSPEFPDSLWDIQHEYVISTSDDRAIQINSIVPMWQRNEDHNVVIEFHRSATSSVSVHEDYFSVLSVDAQLSLWKLKAPTETFGKLKLTILACIQQKTLAFKLWSPVESQNLTITGIADGCRPVNIIVNPKPEENSHFFWKQYAGPRPIIVNSENIESCNMPFGSTKAYVWRKNIFVFITSAQTLCISVDGEHYKEFLIMPFLYGVPTCIHVHHHLFFIGLDSGAVAVYQFSSPENLLTLNIGQPCCQLQMSVEPITQLAVAAVPDTIKLLAVTDHTMHIAYLV